MNIVIPMAGNGKRFAKSGFTLPKPLIKVAGKMMYQQAVDCLPLHLAKKLIFILRRNNFSDQLINSIETYYGNTYQCRIVILEEDTQGQAETVLRCADFLDKDKSTLIHNCDTSAVPRTPWEAILQQNIDGAIMIFPAIEKKWSYVKLNHDNTRIIEIREKKVISPYASTGTYFFKDTNELLANIKNLIDRNQRENNEFYLSTVYHFMLNQAQAIVPLWCDKMLCYGTPPDLVNSLNIMLSNEKLKKQKYD